ncbi:MAG: thiamine-phosphate pyrophosphorylase [Solirubrobacterales bacterium]|jgi:thiamine-phosphate pyrophosphorylase|nr:thiamine-phosphate pyrophosphorylase [Solirubrobacterales bacterium]
MVNARVEAVLSWFELLGSGRIDEALGLATADVVIDRSRSNAPWRGIDRGREAARAAYIDLTETLDGVRWEATETRPVGRDLVVAATRIAVKGPASGIQGVARGAWVTHFDGERVDEAVLHQSFPEALLAARRRALAEARLYFVCEAQPHGGDPGELLEAAIAGGVDVIQLREKAPRCAEELIAFADPFARAARERGALFFLNDEPDLVAACDADGVHVGQDDEPVSAARAAAGEAALVGLSTHSPEQFDAALSAVADGRPDQVSAGPVWETPTKPGRTAAGIGLVEHAARVAGPELPWFAIGGIDAENVGAVVAAGARRIVVVRAIRDADDPGGAARALRTALDDRAGG